MRLRILFACLILTILPAAAQTPDPISGKWGSDDATFLDLAHDGKGAVTGTVIWRAGGKEVTPPIGRGTFDATTGALTLEGTGGTPDGDRGTYTIKGIDLTGDVIRGIGTPSPACRASSPSIG